MNSCYHCFSLFIQHNYGVDEEVEESSEQLGGPSEDDGYRQFGSLDLCGLSSYRMHVTGLAMIVVVCRLCGCCGR